MFYPTLPEDTQDFGQVLSGVGRSLRDISRGVSYYPYDLLGSGVDVANLALGAVGLGSERPVLGSDYLRNIARSLGMAQEPTGSATENITRLAAGLTNPMAGARAVGRVGDITTEQANRAADALVRQITGNPEATAPAVLEAAGQMSPLSVYRQTTPLKPDPTVGTRFEREFMGGLAEKTPVKIEDLKGSSALVVPWDLTSRNYKVTSISDEPLASPVITHGGQDYARDLAHIEQGIGGASNLGIAQRIKNRDIQARIENLEAGGTGRIIHFPATMGDQSEFFSVMPTQAIFGLLDARTPSKETIKGIDKSIREAKIPGKEGAPLKNFKGIMTEEGRMQLLTGEGLDVTAGKARTAFMQKLSLKGNQEKLGFNMEDLSAALTDPSLAGVPKGYIGNTVMATGEGGMHLRPSINPTYNTDFTAQYLGSLGQSVPLEVLFPKTFDRITQEMAGKKGNARNIAIGTMEKRNEGVSEFIDQQVIDNYYEYLRKLNAGLLN